MAYLFGIRKKKKKRIKKKEGHDNMAAWRGGGVDIIFEYSNANKQTELVNGARFCQRVHPRGVQ
jgi:hypothetical protein